MRCFVAVDIPDNIKANIIAMQKTLPETNLRFVAPENMHFTLKFFGECDDSDISYIKKILSEISSKFNSFNTLVEGSGAFPSLKYIKVIWIGCPGLCPLMNSLQRAFSDRFVEEKDAIPHLTLARVGHGADYDALADFVKSHEGFHAGSMNIHEIKLKSSILHSNGPVYNDIAVFRLLP